MKYRILRRDNYFGKASPLGAPPPPETMKRFDPNLELLVGMDMAAEKEKELFEDKEKVGRQKALSASARERSSRDS